MSIFQFVKSQRVTVPAAMAGAENVQGIVAEGHAELGAEPRYILQWANADKLGDNGIFVMVVGEVSQGELAKAQPPKMLTEAEANKLAEIYHDKGFDNGRIVGLAEAQRARRQKAKRSTRIRKRR